MAERGRGRRVLTIIGIIFLVVFVAGATSFGVLWYISQPDEGEAGGMEMGPTHELGEYTVNLTASSRYQFLQTTVVIEVSEDDVIDQLESRAPQVQDSMISVFRNTTDEELDEPGVPELKNNIKEVLNGLSSEGEIRSVWFTDFVVQ